MNEKTPDPTTDKKPEAAPAGPGLVQVLLAVGAALCFLFHGVADIAEWAIIWSDSGEPVADMPVAEEAVFESESNEPAFPLPPVWVGAFMALSLPLGLLLACAAEWNFQKIPWKAGVLFCVLGEAIMGVVYFLYFYQVGNLEPEGIIFGLAYLAWYANRLILLGVWNSTRKWFWLLPAAGLALIFAGCALFDILTYIFAYPGTYRFSFLQGSFIEEMCMKINDVEFIAKYSWLGAKGFITLSLLLLPLPVIFKQRPTRSC